MNEIIHGSRVLVSDHRLYKNDKDTPWHTTLMPAIVICRYGKRIRRILCGDRIDWKYPDLIDVIFDHRPNYISHGHFTEGIRLI